MVSTAATTRSTCLSEDNAKQLREALAPFVEKARRLGRGQKAATPAPRSPARADREQTQAIRRWARERGHNVSDRGRIPKGIVAAYHAEN